MPEWPSVYRKGRNGEVPQDMCGATIVGIGTLSDIDTEGGGLVIDYRTKAGEARRIILAFNEVGMWVHEAHGVLATGIAQDRIAAAQRERESLLIPA